MLNININQGISDLLELIKENKDFSYFFKNIARIYVKQDNVKEAIETYNKYLKLFPYDEGVRNELSDLK